MDEQQEKLKSSLDAWAETVKKGTQQELAKVTFKVLLSTTPAIEKFISWQLAITGATLALLLSNIKPIMEVTAPSSIKLPLLLLLISALSGAIAKWLALIINLKLHTFDKIEEYYKHVFEEHKQKETEISETSEPFIDPPDTSIDFKNVVETVISSLPKRQKEKYLKGAENGQKDPLFTLRTATKNFTKMGIFSFSQTAFFLLFFIVIIFNINS